MKTNPTPSIERLMAIYAEIETDRLHAMGFHNLKVVTRLREDEYTCNNRMERVKSE